MDNRAALRGWNRRLAAFTRKVQQLEQHKHLLEREVEEVRGRGARGASWEEEHGAELRKLRQMVQDMTQHKHRAEIQNRNLQEEVSDLQRQHEQEARARSRAQSGIVALRRDIQDARQVKMLLGERARSLAEEISFLERSHEAELSEMMDRFRDLHARVGARGSGNPRATAALGGIRAQLEGHDDVRQVGDSLQHELRRLSEAVEAKRAALNTSRQEARGHRRRLQGKAMELDSAEGTREALEEQLHEAEDRHMEEIIHYQNTIKELENELLDCKFDMSGYLREYQDLLSVKMALDVEIMSYRKLLCGEESQLSNISDNHITLPYIYRQSPVYTLPRFSRPGGPLRRAEPQYKFVEEIITETTREIEMSEFEDIGWVKTDARSGSIPRETERGAMKKANRCLEVSRTQQHRNSEIMIGGRGSSGDVNNDQKHQERKGLGQQGSLVDEGNKQNKGRN